MSEWEQYRRGTKEGHGKEIRGKKKETHDPSDLAGVEPVLDSKKP